MPVGVVHLDPAGRIAVASTSFRALARLGPRKLRLVPLQALLHPEDRARYETERAAMLAAHRSGRFEGRLLRPNGTTAWVAMTLALVGPRGGHRGVVASVVAVKRQTANRDAQRMEELGRLAGGVAHDFNNVLQAIAGAARLIQRRVHDPAAVKRLATLMVEATQRGAMVTDRLLSFARRRRLNPTLVDPADVLTQIGALLTKDFGVGLTVEVNVTPGVPFLMVDRVQLENVLIGLGTNAGDAMVGANTAPGRFACQLSAYPDNGMSAGLPKGRYVRIEIADGGPGMDADTLHHAMEPFFTTKPRQRGTGLGLAMARGFAEQSGGRLMLTSISGGGTVATLVLPAGREDQAGSGRPIAPSRPRIMLVDDDPDVRDVVSELLDAYGFAPIAFEGAAAALTWLDTGQPLAAVISDLSMPVTDGLTLIREAKRRRPGLPAILMTGYGAQDVAPGAGPDRIDLLEKPVRSADLVSMLERLISGPD